jgi:hypothetical protein
MRISTLNIELFYVESNQLKKLPPVLVLRLQPDQHNAHSSLSVRGLLVGYAKDQEGEIKIEGGF